MAMNPMQKKAQNSFLLGILVTLLITGIIIGLLVIKLANMTKEQKLIEASKVRIFVLSEDLESGEEVTIDKMQSREMDASTVPSNALSLDKLNAMTNVYDEDGNLIKKVKVISKINLKAGTVITSDMIKEEGNLESDVRKVEYNTISLGSQLEDGKYIDIRLRLPSGGDYIVVSHKKIEIPEIDGVPSLSTIWLELSETEILTLNCALVENYKIEGSVLYATEYIEAGLQESATVTYIPNAEVMRLVLQDPNCVEAAKQEILARYQADKKEQNDKNSAIRTPINNALSQNSDNATDNLNTKLEEEVKTMQEERQKYLETLGGSY